MGEGKNEPDSMAINDFNTQTQNREVLLTTAVQSKSFRSFVNTDIFYLHYTVVQIGSEFY